MTAGPVTLAVGAVLVTAAVCLSAAHAHHAPTIYDLTRTVTLEGTVVRFDWIQPHTEVVLATAEPTDRTDAAGGETGVWTLEGMNPSYLGRRNWIRTSLAPGDRISVVIFPRRDGSRSGLFLRATLPDGSLKVMAVEPDFARGDSTATEAAPAPDGDGAGR